jgi:hypothetical protein
MIAGERRRNSNSQRSRPYDFERGPTRGPETGEAQRIIDVTGLYGGSLPNTAERTAASTTSDAATAA